MYEFKKKLERYLRVNLLRPGPRLMKKNLPGRGLPKFEKHRRGGYFKGDITVERGEKKKK